MDASFLACGGNVTRAVTARLWPALACALLLGVMAMNMLTVIAIKNVTIDETVLIPSGYYHLTRGYSSLTYEHPPLSKLIAAAALLPLDVHTLPTPDRRLRAAGEPDLLTRFWGDNAAAIDRIGFWARVPAIALTIGLGLLIFAFAQELFGAVAAVLAVALFTLEPTVLAHGRVVQTDIPAAFGCLLLLFAVWRYVHGPSALRALALGAAGAVAFLAKFSMIIAAPLIAGVLLLMVFRMHREQRPVAPLLRDAALAAIAALIVINAAYPIHGRALADWETQAIHALFNERAPLLLGAINVLTYLLPTDFMLGILNQYVHNQFGHSAGLLGMHSQHGWPYYFAVAFALKTPIPVLIASLAALAWCGYRAIALRDARCMLLFGGFAVYVVYCSFSRIAIGVRYLLPAYPLLFIMIGGMLAAMLQSPRLRVAGLVTAAIALLWSAAEAVRTYPDYMSSMNALASPQPRWHYLSDSNVEWGDDVRALAGFLHDQGETKVQGALLNSALLPFYGIDFVDLLQPTAGDLPATRYVALGASYLNGSALSPGPVRGRILSAQERVNYFEAYRERQPVRIIGGSIYVFRNDG